MNLRALSLAVAGLLALVFLSQGLNAPFEKDEESRPASIIADILHRGDWLLPADSYGEVTRKPPLYYWLSAALAKGGGGTMDEARARTVSLLAGAILAALVMGYAAGWFGDATGWLAWLFVLGSYGFCARAGYARTDMLFTLLIFSAYCMLYPAIEGNGAAGRWFAAGVILGLAVLTKGPLAIVLCGLGILIYLLMVRRNPLELAMRPGPWLTLLAAVAVASVWYLPALLKTHGAIARVQLGQENLGHLVPAGIGGTGEAHRPFYYILARFIGASFPLSLYLPAAVAMLRPMRKAAHPLLYQFGLMIAVLGLFSIASAKRDDYILPAFPPFAIVLAATVTARVRENSSTSVRLRDWAGGLGGLLMLAGAVTGLFLAWQGPLVQRLIPHMQSSDASYMGLFIAGFWRGRQALMVLAIALAAAASLLAWWRGNVKAVAAAVALASMAGISVWIGILRPGLASRRTFRTFAIGMRQVTGGQPIFISDGPEYEISYYYGAPIQPLEWRHGGQKNPAPFYLITWKDQVKGDGPASSRQLLASRPTLEGRQLLLLKVGANGFESFPKEQ
ncbi:MAG: ArnT family glycosyltransferase [Candidatus Binataceae bacterium]